MESERTFDGGNEMDGPLCPTTRFHRVRDSFQFLHGVNLGQHQRPNGGNSEDADDVALEEGGTGVIYANGDARRMWKLVLRDFLHEGSALPIDYEENLAIRNSVSRSLASVLPFSEGAMLSSRS